MSTTRELYTCDLPDGRTIGFYDFDFTPGWQGTQRDPPEAPEFDIQCALWLHEHRHVGLTPVELLTLHIDDAAHACVLARVEEIVERREGLLRGERTRAKSDAIKVHSSDARACYSEVDGYLDEVARLLRIRSELPAWRLLRARKLGRQALATTALARTAKADGDRARNAARRLRESC